MKIETAITYLNGLLGSGYPKQDKAVQMAIKALEKEQKEKESNCVKLEDNEVVTRF